MDTKEVKFAKRNAAHPNQHTVPTQVPSHGVLDIFLVLYSPELLTIQVGDEKELSDSISVMAGIFWISCWESKKQ